jgi:hypothetical protein
LAITLVLGVGLSFAENAPLRIPVMADSVSI